MTIIEFRQQLETLSMRSRKNKGFETYDIISNGTFLCEVMLDEIHRAINVKQLLSDKLRPEYIPPLG